VTKETRLRRVPVILTTEDQCTRNSYKMVVSSLIVQ
jgi:hypothetical protein